jgi:DNA-binding transcriptional regulator YiaG
MGYTWIPMAELLKDRLKKWRGDRRQKNAADDLRVSLATYRKWENGKRTPNALAMAELDRRIISNAK